MTHVIGHRLDREHIFDLIDEAVAKDNIRDDPNRDYDEQGWKGGRTMRRRLYKKRKSNKKKSNKKRTIRRKRH